MALILREDRGHTGILTLNRPEALNALNRELLAELSEALDAVDPAQTRCLIITGSGSKAFAAGADIGEMMGMKPAEAVEFSRAGNTVFQKMERLPVPVIAAVGGYALGGGCELALCCDMRLASDKAVFGLPEVSLGVIPGYGGLQRLARLTGPGRAKLLAMTARRVPAEQALEWGLVEKVCPGEALMGLALELAEQIAAGAPVAVRAVKRVLQESAGRTMEQAHCLESEPFGSCFATADQKMAMRAFAEKKKPEPFTGS